MYPSVRAEVKDTAKYPATRKTGQTHPPCAIQPADVALATSQCIDPDKTAKVPLNPRFLLFHVVDNAKPRRGSWCRNPVPPAPVDPAASWSYPKPALA